MLIDDFMCDCVVVDRVTTDDGEGGSIINWVDGASIRCAIVNTTSIATKVGDAIRNTSTYEITTKSTIIDFGSIVKRVSDGQTFKIRSAKVDGLFPTTSSALKSYTKYYADKWELTT